MLSIKLKRTGKKKQAAFRVVVAEARSKVGGNFVEDLGWINPHLDKFSIRKDRAEYWMKHGAKATSAVAAYLKKVAS
jgi:small subunit ribosomal protein S16